MRHSRALLQVANVCHPEVDARQRRDAMLDVAIREGMDRWQSRLERRDTVGVALAMRMLTGMEQSGGFVEGYTEDGPASDFVWWSGLALLLLCGVAVCLRQNSVRRHRK
jgi:hypothetical protein